MPHTLLLADDSVTIQRVIELTFADEDITVVAVSDGDQAIARLDATPPDIVLADVGMPGRSGYEVTEYIKQSPQLAHIPVLLLTGAFEPVDQDKAVAAGCDGVLAKPFEPQLVIARVKELLARSAPPSAQAPAAPPAVGSEPNAEALPSEAESSRPPDVQRLDTYFDRLDEAFAALGRDAPEMSAPGADEGVPTVDLPLAYTPPTSQFEPELERGALAAEATPAPVAVVSPPASVPAPAPAPASMLEAPAPLPSLPDAFAALLAAEQRQLTPATAPAWPAPAATPVVTEEAIEAIVARVLERLSDRVLREAVAEIVPGVAERLVREEIERIKASIK